jgi:hypothetical protein
MRWPFSDLNTRWIKEEGILRPVTAVIIITNDTIATVAIIITFSVDESPIE